MIWWLVFEKKPFKFWREIWIHSVAIFLQLYGGLSRDEKKIPKSTKQGRKNRLLDTVLIAYPRVTNTRMTTLVKHTITVQYLVSEKDFFLFTSYVPQLSIVLDLIWWLQ